VVVTGDPAGARARAREQSAGYDALPSYRRALDREGVASGADLLLAGTTDDVVQGLAAYARAGATDLRLAVHAGDPDERDATREALAAALAR
jgi:alkanesulfonate monooxygenase SsuD/methylene tetrahydromethanopterin reductase-like flavin-dependent oxidoreductase (luciferase family)